MVAKATFTNGYEMNKQTEALKDYAPKEMTMMEAIAEYTKAKDNVDFAKLNKYMKDELLDDDGYPTESALEIVKLWHWTDKRGWFDFIKSIWWTPSWGWHEHQKSKDEKVIIHTLELSTGGWSGNESVISAMQDNTMLWHMTWVQSRRGGHYIFELKGEHNDDEQTN